MRIMFMGTPDFAVSALDALNKNGHDIVSVVTTPDKPRGRGHKMMHTPVHEYAIEHNMPVYTFTSLKKEFFESTLKDSDPEVIVVAAYGKILPKYVLDYPKYGCINIHASLLPKYRGAAPIQRAIMDGETQTGISTMYMDVGLDTGDILQCKSVEILKDDNFGTLHDKLASVGAELILSTLDSLKDGTYTRIKQDDSKSTYASMITKDTAKINWNDSAKNICNLVRSLYPIPKSETVLNGKKLKIGKCVETEVNTKSCTSGTVINVTAKSFLVSCGGQTAVEVLMLQPEGKKIMSTADYLKGNVIETGTVLGG